MSRVFRLVRYLVKRKKWSKAVKHIAQHYITLNRDEFLQLLSNDRDAVFAERFQDSLNYHSQSKIGTEYITYMSVDNV